MADIRIDFSKTTGPIKIMNAVNNGPVYDGASQQRGNLEAYKEARFPYARNHDASFCEAYGGEHIVDIHVIFPDFDADPEDPASYDFVNTDLYCRQIIDAGTKIFYRLGTKIEEPFRKYGSLVPKDFGKWAVICEHVIRHLNYGWANGHHFGITYWEIWNEPDLTPDDARPEDKQTWGGTKAQFFDLFETAAKHLKKTFPELKIGGPASCGRIEWIEDFLREMQKRNVPMDFFSWHIYTDAPACLTELGERVHFLMDRYGYGTAESICDEWNYIRSGDGWTSGFIYSIKAITGMKGAALVGDVMNRSQHSRTDMLMYYDARPTVFNGLFDFYTMECLKAYYPLYFWANLRELGLECEGIRESDGITVTAARNPKGDRGGIFLTYYEIDDLVKDPKSVKIRIYGMDNLPESLNSFYLNKDHEPIIGMLSAEPDGSYQLEMEPNSILYLMI